MEVVHQLLSKICIGIVGVGPSTNMCIQYVLALAASSYRRSIELDQVY